SCVPPGKTRGEAIQALFPWNGATEIEQISSQFICIFLIHELLICYQRFRAKGWIRPRGCSPNHSPPNLAARKSCLETSIFPESCEFQGGATWNRLPSANPLIIFLYRGLHVYELSSGLRGEIPEKRRRPDRGGIRRDAGPDHR